MFTQALDKSIDLLAVAEIIRQTVSLNINSTAFMANGLVLPIRNRQDADAAITTIDKDWTKNALHEKQRQGSLNGLRLRSTPAQLEASVLYFSLSDEDKTITNSIENNPALLQSFEQLLLDSIQRTIDGLSGTTTAKPAYLVSTEPFLDGVRYAMKVVVSRYLIDTGCNFIAKPVFDLTDMSVLKTLEHVARQAVTAFLENQYLNDLIDAVDEDEEDYGGLCF